MRPERCAIELADSRPPKDKSVTETEASAHVGIPYKQSTKYFVDSYESLRIT